jgi:transposase
MSTRELRPAEVLGRVKGETLRLVDAAKMLELSYRQAQRLWQRYREEGAKRVASPQRGRQFEPREAQEIPGKSVHS